MKVLPMSPNGVTHVPEPNTPLSKGGRCFQVYSLIKAYQFTNMNSLPFNSTRQVLAMPCFVA